MKKLKYLLLLVVFSFLTIVDVNAVSGSINQSTGTKTAAVGSTFTVTVKVSCSEALGSWQYGITYDTSYLSLVEGNTNVVDYGTGANGPKSKTYTLKFKALKSGAASVKVSSPSMVGWSSQEELFTPSVSNVSVNIKTQSEIQASYSKDNNLKSLSVEDYELSPVFNKDTTSYTVSVPDTVEKIKVHAAVNDSTARVSGTGEIDISEGTNKIEVVVTAQNGSLKTYTITVDVKDLNPIETEIDGVKYTVVKKADLLKAPIGFKEETIKIGDVDVPGFISELAGLTVVGLKDENANIGMFVYDSSTNTYKPYDEIRGTSITIVISEIEVESIPVGFVKDRITINDKEYEALKSEFAEAFYLVYGLDVETGEKDYFIYDKKSGSILRYNPNLVEGLVHQNKEYVLYLFALGGIVAIFFMLTILQTKKNAKLKKLLRKLSKVGSEEPTHVDISIEEPANESVEEEIHREDDEEEIEEDFLEEKKKKKRKKR